MSTITNLQIEQFYNKDNKTEGSNFTPFNNISPTLVKIIKEVLTNK